MVKAHDFVFIICMLFYFNPVLKQIRGYRLVGSPWLPLWISAKKLSYTVWLMKISAKMQRTYS